MNYKVTKIFKTIIIICIICIFIILPLLNTDSCNDKDMICKFVSYTNTFKHYGEYTTIYEGMYTIDSKDMYVFTNVYPNDNCITYALYMDEYSIVYYGELDFYK